MASTPPPPPSNGIRSRYWLLDKINRFHDAHERLKHSVHSYWRQNAILSPRGTAGKFFMSCVYFSIPVVAGYFIANEAVAVSESTVQERFGDCSVRSNDTAYDRKSSNERIEKIGAGGGWGGGVNLATSDSKTQEINRINLERFMKKQRKLKEKREQEAENL